MFCSNLLPVYRHFANILLMRIKGPIVLPEISTRDSSLLLVTFVVIVEDLWFSSWETFSIVDATSVILVLTVSLVTVVLEDFVESWKLSGRLARENESGLSLLLLLSLLCSEAGSLNAFWASVTIFLDISIVVFSSIGWLLYGKIFDESIDWQIYWFVDRILAPKDPFSMLTIKSIYTYSIWVSTTSWTCFDWSGGLVAASHVNSQLLLKILRLSTWFSRAKRPTAST